MHVHESQCFGGTTIITTVGIDESSINTTVTMEIDGSNDDLYNVICSSGAIVQFIVNQMQGVVNSL